MRTRTSSPGFTLIELMIVVAIVAIIAAVAYPAYTQQVRKSKRADAQSLLMQVAGRQQQFLLDTRSYAPDSDWGALGVQPTPSVSGHYTVSWSTSTATVPAFTATATPLGAQVADQCGTLSINQAGIKSPAACW